MKFTGRGLRCWLPYYLWEKMIPKESADETKLIHIFVCIVDHFEPFVGGVDSNNALARVETWKKEYPKFAKKHLDSEGKPLQHTWFYPPHLDHNLLPYLVEMCNDGYGEIEMHLHHNHMKPFPDNSETLKKKINDCIDDYGKYGIFKQPDGTARFAFIHGDWSLDNSGGPHICGVNDELTILKDCGCYADFTFPCLSQSQPAMVNQIYYAIDNLKKPKSYNRGIPVTINRRGPKNGLMLIQGIIGLRYDKVKKTKVAIDYSDLSINNNPNTGRVQYWVNNALTIRGQPNYKFIKLHTHGAPEYNWEANWGKDADDAFFSLNNLYNDGKKYCLHYVTAREMYNYIIMVERGVSEYSSDYNDFMIKKYQYK